MDYLTRSVLIFICCLCAGSVANGNILDAVKNVIWTLTGNSLISYDKTHETRRFLNDKAATSAFWTEWHAASKCTTSCGPGFTEEQRGCSTGNNQDCAAQGGTYWRLGQCNTPCGAHWTDWHILKPCSVTCGTGVQVRKRECSSGKAEDCTEGKAIEFSTCSPGACITTTQTAITAGPPVWSSWSAAQACTKTCGHGFSERTRTCSTGKNSDCSGMAWEVLGCNEGPCMVDGSWGEWSAWTNCSASCGQSQRSRNRTCTYATPNNPGQPCSGISVDTEDCKKPSCAVDGVWSEWSKYSACTASCGQGFQVRNRNCSYPTNAPHGKSCTGRNNDLTVCQAGECAVDGTFSNWSKWTPCTKTCDGGYEFRNRYCKYEDNKPRGKACNGTTFDGRQCNNTKCAVDGLLSQWSSWTTCSHTCNGGLQFRDRVCVFDSTAPRGADCVGKLKENRDCSTLECPVDGTWGSWGQWAHCTKTCGSGTSIRSRTCEYKTLTAPHGKVCEGESFEKKNCSATPCQVDGTWSTWTVFSICTVTCGDGDQYRTRSCKISSTDPLGNKCLGKSVDARKCHKIACPVDGTFTDWGSWSICVKSCGNGTQVRSRDCYFPQNMRHGKDCVGALTEATSCNESPCPETTTMMPTTTEASANGSWSSWDNWSSCSLSCGTGSQSRSRICTYPDHTLHDQVCRGSNTTTRDCNTNDCPVDGVWSSWSLFGRCTASCGNGTTTRKRTCTFDARYPKGADCVGNETTSTQSCNAGPCPVDGSWGAWGAWSTCPVTCGGSVIERTRICEYQDGVPHGQTCVGQSHENQTCATTQCPVDGILSQWTTWTDCPVTCGNGTQTRSRSCDFRVGIPHGKDCAGDLSQIQLCSYNLCPVDGVFTDWSDWKRCSKSCGGGLQQRTRYCHYDQHAPHGKSCSGATTETKDCNTGLCPVDGIWGGWGPYSVCSQTCEAGLHSRVRQCSFLHGYPHGKDCVGTSNQTETCNNGPCPVDGSWSAWSGWSQCSASCGNGTSSRDRICDFPAGSVHGANCTGDAREVKVCGTSLCPVDGQFGVWSQWSSCPVTCGGGVSSRQRQCEFDPVAPHGLDCVGETSQSQNCSTGLCPVDGVWSTWSPFTNCSHTCGNGTMFRKRKCEFTAGYPHGVNCSGHETESASCNPNPCPVDGHFTDWSGWSACSKSCNNGTQSRSRRCEFDNIAPHGDTCVGDYKENIPCNEELCPINGHWSNWTSYSACSSSCGNGTHIRSRSCVFHDPAPHGSQCFGSTNETSVCTLGPCAVDGVWKDWTTWSDCSATCGAGKRTRGRVCYFPPGVPPGNNCTGNDTQIEDCNLTLCAVDGTLSSWSHWSNCSVTCGDGAQFRTRKCTYPDGVPHGKDCNATLSEANSCQESPCTADGQWSSWKTWGQCDVTCGNGTRSRSRDCEFTPGLLHGANCTGAATETGPCSQASCPVDGAWGTWSDFSSCSKSCGNGTATRTRTCDFPAGTVHGLDCTGNAQETLPCNVTDCREDGVWGAWTAWSACSATCGMSNKTHTRMCIWPTSVHGDTCQGDSMETVTCNVTLCPVNGTWSNWGNWSTCSASCDAGIRTRTRVCDFDAHAPRGADCEGSKKQDDSCKIADCEVDGVWSSWTKWSVCSQTCENGTQSRTRNCVFSPATAPRGKNCSGDAAETSVCTNPQDCPVNGIWGTWSSWSSCSATCGNVEKYRTRNCDFDPNKPRGHDCFGAANETVSCGLSACPVDGQWSSWLAWQACSVTCGGSGTKERSRQCTYPDKVPHGLDCSGSAKESAACGSTFECPVSGFWDSWERWHRCSVACGGGTRKRTRQCVFPPHVQQGSYCSGSSRDSEPCNTQACP